MAVKAAVSEKSALSSGSWTRPGRTSVRQREPTPGVHSRSKPSLMLKTTKKKKENGKNKGKKETGNSSLGVYDNYLFLTGVKFQE